MSERPESPRSFSLLKFTLENTEELKSLQDAFCGLPNLDIDMWRPILTSNLLMGITLNH